MKLNGSEGFKYRRKLGMDEDEAGVTNTVVGLEEDDESSSKGTRAYTAIL